MRFPSRSHTRSTAPAHVVDTVGPLRQLVPLGLQHVMVGYAGMVTVPLLIGLGIGLSNAQIATLVTANVLVVGLERFARPALGRFAILISLGLGTLVAWPLGMTDFSTVGQASLFGLVHPFEFGAPTFTIAAILPMLVVQLVNMVESTGDTLAIGQIVDKPIGSKEVARALRADGAGTAFAGVFNSFTIVTFGENVGLVSITKVMSRFVVATAGLILVILGLMPKLGALVAALPGPVLGGIGVVMFGTVGAVGVKIMMQSDLGQGRSILIVAISFGFGLMPVGAPKFYVHLPVALQTILSSGIAAGGIAAFSLNLLLNHGARAAQADSGTIAEQGVAAEPGAAAAGGDYAHDHK